MALRLYDAVRVVIKGLLRISGQALILVEMNVDKGSGVAGLAGRRARTSRCAGDCSPLAGEAKLLRTGQPVNHGTVVLPVNVRAEQR